MEPSAPAAATLEAYMPTKKATLPKKRAMGVSPPLELKMSLNPLAGSAAYCSMKSPLSQTSSPFLPSKIEMDLQNGRHGAWTCVGAHPRKRRR